jgi:hypothetical protein
LIALANFSGDAVDTLSLDLGDTKSVDRMPPACKRVNAALQLAFRAVNARCDKSFCVIAVQNNVRHVVSLSRNKSVTIAFPITNL